jgi:hypothetical protein
MDDLVMAIQISLVAKYGPTPQPKPLHPIHQELLDYVNSPEYRQLEINEWLTEHSK